MFFRLLMFTFKKLTYIYDSERSEFVQLRGLDQNIVSDVIHSNRGLSRNEAFVRRLVYGPNEILIRESTIVTLLFLEVLNPFYIFQILSFCLWFADQYYYYAAAIMAMSIFGISATVVQTRQVKSNFTL